MEGKTPTGSPFSPAPLLVANLSQTMSHNAGLGLRHAASCQRQNQCGTLFYGTSTFGCSRRTIGQKGMPRLLRSWLNTCASESCIFTGACTCTTFTQRCLSTESLSVFSRELRCFCGLATAYTYIKALRSFQGLTLNFKILPSLTRFMRIHGTA